MNRPFHAIFLTSITLLTGLLLAGVASAQLIINEIEADPGNQQNDSCQYVELKGDPGSTVPANTWFVAIDSDSAFPGTLNMAVNIGGQVVGSNGTLTLVNTFGTLCPNRTFASGTTVLNYSSPLRIGGGNVNVGSESFVILNTATNLIAGSDADSDDDGTLNFAATFIDAVAFIVNPDEQNIYPLNAPILGTPFTDVPDALVRFCSNTTAFAADAYYWGEVADSPDESVQLIAPLSANFPAGGVLTPGDVNAPCASPSPTPTPTPNIAPDAVGDAATVEEDSTNNIINVLANDTDSDGGTLTITGATNGSNGTVVNNTTNVSYTPNANFFGQDSFTYTISDGQGGSDTATVTVTVTDVVEGAGFLRLNEVEADPGDQQNDTCQFIEVLGETPGGVVPANTWVLAVDSDSATPGFIHAAINIGGQTVGANGTITLVNNFGNFTCPNRTYPAGSNVVFYQSPLRIGGGNLSVGSESFIILESAANIFAGLDADADDDGQLDFAVTQYIDGAAFLVNPDEQFAYPSNTAVLGVPFTDVPDALIRFEGNTTAFDPAAFYWAEVATSPSETTELTDPRSANFPQCAALTPGAPNTVVPGCPTPSPTPTPTPTPNAAPDAVDDAVTVAEDTTSNVINVLANDTDPEGQTLTVLSVTQGTNGTVVNNGVNVSYTPNANFFGQDTFTYTISDGFGGQDTATVTVTVTDVPEPTPTPAPSPRNAIVDYNGDGKTDLSITRLTNGLLTWWNQFTGTNDGATFQWGTAGDVQTPEDFDGDGKDDIAIWRPGSEGEAAFYIFQSETNTFAGYAFGKTGDDPSVIGDWDGDQIADVAVFRAQAIGNQSAFYFRSSETGNITEFLWGLAGDRAIRADFDGDGQIDPAIFRPSTRDWWVFRSSDFAVDIRNWGLASDTLVIGDFDNDGKNDHTVYREGTWWIWRSSDNQFAAYRWGIQTDIPVAGDYDGDGATDLAVWRDGVFWIAGSGGSLFAPNWGAPGDFPVASTFNN